MWEPLWKKNVGTLGDQPGILLAIHAAKCNVMCANLEKYQRYAPQQHLFVSILYLSNESNTN